MEVAGSSNAQKRKHSPDRAMDTSEKALKYKKMAGFATTKGQDFEVALAALLFVRGLESQLEFQLATNVLGAGAMDDIVLRFKSQQEGAVWTTMFVQLKHKDNSWVNRNMLTNPKGDFSLEKYFKSYQEIKQAMTSTGRRDVLFDGDFKDSQFVIFTNAKADDKLVGSRSGNFSQAEKLLWSGSGKIFSFETDQEMLKCLGAQGGEFLSRLRLFCKQPNVMELKAAVREEISKLGKEKIGDLNIERLCDCYLANVKVWWESKNEILDKGHDILRGAVNKVRLETCSEQTLKDYKLELDFEDAAISYFKMQLVQLNSPMFHIVSSDSSCKLTLTKLVQSSEVQLFVLPAQQLSVHQQALLAEKKQLIVVAKDWRSVQLDVIVEMLDIMRDTFSIVILSDGNKDIGSQLSERFPGGFASHRDDFKISQLRSDSKVALLYKVVNFQGNKMTLSTFLNNDNEYLDPELTAALIVDILECVAPFKVGSVLPKDIGYFVPRTLVQPLVKSSVLQALQGTVTLSIMQSEPSDRGLFGKALDFLSSLRSSQSFNNAHLSNIILRQLIESPLVPDSKDCGVFVGPKFPLEVYEFNCVGLRLGRENELIALRVSTRVDSSKKLSFLFVWNETNEDDITKLSEFYGSKHLFCLKDGHLRIIKSYEDIESIRKHIDEDQVSRFAPETAVDVDDRLVLVCAEPGMGKSTLMARLAKNTKEALPHYFVILIALNDHTKLFAEDKHEDALEFLSLAAKMESPLQRSLLKSALEVSGNVVVILDGFDEIAPRYVQQSCHLLSSLLGKTKARKIWMASRNSVKETLEKHVSKLSVKLREFIMEDQKDFFETFWAAKSKKSATKLDEIIEKLLEKSSKAIRDKEKSFLGIPLQCQMLAEVFKYLVDGSTENAQLPDKLDLFSLVEMFVDKKCKVLVEKLRIDSASTDFEDRCEKEKELFIKGLSKVGLVLILGEEELKEMGKKKIIKDASAFRNRIQQGTDKTGFVYEIENDKPRFVHRIFAEYFVAKWFSKHFEDNKKLVESKMYTPDFTVVRYFFDRTLCKLHDLEILDKQSVSQMPCKTCCVLRHSENSPFPTLCKDCAPKLLYKDCVLHTAVLQEEVEQVNTLLESEDVDVEVQDAGGRTALHLAASLGASEDQEENTRRCEILDLIIGKTRDFKVVDKVLCGSPLRYADITRWWTAIDKLLCETDDNGQLILTLEDVGDKDMLETIIKQDLDKLLGFCLDNGLQVEHRYEGGWYSSNERLLVHACCEGSVKVASLLIERNADINTIIVARNQDGSDEDQDGSDEDQCDHDGPLSAASYRGHLEIVKLLVEKYVSTLASPSQCEVLDGETKHPDIPKYINTKNKLGKTAIHEAAMGGHPDVITYLLSQGGDPLSRDNDDKTPLHLAAEFNKPAALRVLLEAVSETQRVDVIHSLDKDGDNVLHHAAYRGSVECLQLLIDAGGKLSQVKPPLPYGDITRWLIAIDKLLCKTDDNRQLTLTLEDVRDKVMLDTIFKQDLDKLLGFCLDNGLQVEHRYEDYYENHHDDYYDDYYRNNDEQRLLVHACYEGSVKVASLLIERNANINTIVDRNQDGSDEDQDGSDEDQDGSDEDQDGSDEDQDGSDEDQDGSDEDQCDYEGPLIAASSQGHLEIVKLLVDKYVSTLASPSQCEVLDGETKHPDISKYINMKNKLGRTAIHEAARQGRTDVITYLLSQGGDPLSRDNKNKTPLHLAAVGNEPAALRVLLEALSETQRVDVIHSLDNRGSNVLHNAACIGSVECLQLLFDAGGKLCQVNCKGETTLMAAASGGKQEAVKWLLENFNKEREGITLVDFINKKDKDVNTAMYHAAWGGSVECLQLLFDAGGKLCQVNCRGETTLMRSASRGRQEAVKWLLENFNKEREGITLVDFIKMKDKDGNTARDIACEPWVDKARDAKCRELIANFMK